RVVLAVVAEPTTTTGDENLGSDALEDFAPEVEQALVVAVVAAGDLGLDPRVLGPNERDLADLLRGLPEELLVGVAVGRQLNVLGEVSDRRRFLGRLELDHCPVHLDEVDDAPDRDIEDLAGRRIYECQREVKL